MIVPTDNTNKMFQDNHNISNNDNNNNHENEIEHFQDLPKFLKFGIKYAASRYKKTYVVIQFLVQFGSVLPIFGFVTKSLVLSMVLCGYLFITNLNLVMQPDFTKGVFLNLLLHDTKITKKINDNTFKAWVGTMVIFQFITPPFLFYFIVWQFANDPAKMLGPSTFTITIVISIIGQIAMIPMFILNSCQTLTDQVSLVHISTIQNYLEKIRDIIVNDNNNNVGGGEYNFVEEDGMSLVDKLSQEQEQVEKWIMKINNGMSTFNTIQLCNYIGGCILFLFIAAGGYGFGATIGCAICALFLFCMIGNNLYAMSKPNMVWEQERILLLNDAKVFLNLKFERENFDIWLQNHNINSSKAFGTKITFERMQQAAGLLISAFGIAFYALLQDIMSNVYDA